MNFNSQVFGLDSFVIGVMPHCLDEGTMEKVVFRKIDGKNWEKAISDNPDVRLMSSTSS